MALLNVSRGNSKDDGHVFEDAKGSINQVQKYIKSEATAVPLVRVDENHNEDKKINSSPVKKTLLKDTVTNGATLSSSIKCSHVSDERTAMTKNRPEQSKVHENPSLSMFFLFPPPPPRREID